MTNSKRTKEEEDKSVASVKKNINSIISKKLLPYLKFVNIAKNQTKDESNLVKYMR